MRGTPPEKLQTNSEGKSKTNPNYLTGNCLRINLLNFDTLPLIRRCAPPSPRGRLRDTAFRRNSHRHPTNGARLKRGSSPYRTRPRSVGGNRTKIVRGDCRSTSGEGVLRTIGSKRVFAEPQRGVSERNRAQRGSWRGDGDFLLAQKVTRRRHNTIQYTVGYRQKEPPSSAEQKSPR